VAKERAAQGVVGTAEVWVVEEVEEISSPLKRNPIVSLKVSNFLVSSTDIIWASDRCILVGKETQRLVASAEVQLWTDQRD
jgi:hypothetical protein